MMRVPYSSAGCTLTSADKSEMRNNNFNYLRVMKNNTTFRFNGYEIRFVRTNLISVRWGKMRIVQKYKASASVCKVHKRYKTSPRNLLRIIHLLEDIHIQNEHPTLYYLRCSYKFIIKEYIIPKYTDICITNFGSTSRSIYHSK